MSFRGKTAIVGIGETAHKRSWPNRSALGLAAEAAAEAINDAGLRREDIDGLISISMSLVRPRPWSSWSRDDGRGIRPKKGLPDGSSSGSDSIRSPLK